MYILAVDFVFVGRHLDVLREDRHARCTAGKINGVDFLASSDTAYGYIYERIVSFILDKKGLKNLHCFMLRCSKLDISYS